jgi:hypothetical protein
MKWLDLARPEDPRLLEKELDSTTRIGSFMNLSIHILHGWEKPACMAEIGLIREEQFRAMGAGRNVSRDIDDLDMLPGAYRQLIAWDPQQREIVSMYRFAETVKILERFGPGRLRTSSLFTFSDEFVSDFLSSSIELGRSVVNRRARRAVAGLFAVWCGLGILVNEHPDMAFFFGNITLSNALSQTGRDAVLYFLHRFYSSPETRRMVQARPGLAYHLSTPEPFFPPDRRKAREVLIGILARENESVPPILLSYLGAVEDLLIFDTARDDDFGDAWETAIAVPVKEINVKTKRRFLEGYTREPGGYFELFPGSIAS